MALHPTAPHRASSECTPTTPTSSLTTIMHPSNRAFSWAVFSPLPNFCSRLGSCTREGRWVRIPYSLCFPSFFRVPWDLRWGGEGKEMGRKLKAERQAVRTPCRQSSTASPSRRWAPPGSGTALRERAGCGELPQSYKKRRKKTFPDPPPRRKQGWEAAPRAEGTGEAALPPHNKAAQRAASRAALTPPPPPSPPPR